MSRTFTSYCTDRSATESKSSELLQRNLAFQRFAMNVSQNATELFDAAVHIKTPEPDEAVLAKIVELRLNLVKEQLYHDYIEWCSDEMCHRFLIARQFNIKASADLLTSALKWRATRIPAVGGIEAQPGWSDRMSKEGATGKIFLPGFDRWNRPLVIFNNSVQNTNSTDDQLTFLAWNLDYACRLMTPVTDKYVVFMHLEVFSIFNCPNMTAIKETIFMLCSGFPERLGHCICYKAPGVFKTVFNTIKSLIDPRTVAKLVFITGDVSDGSDSDLQMKGLIGDDWKVLTGAEQPVYSPGSCPGYDHSVYWPFAMERLEKLLAEQNAKEEGTVAESKDSGEREVKVDVTQDGAAEEAVGMVAVPSTDIDSIEVKKESLSPGDSSAADSAGGFPDCSSHQELADHHRLQHPPTAAP